MDKATKSLLNVLLSVLAPVLILDNCSATGDKLWHLGTTWAMVVALALPIGCGIYSLITERKIEAMTAFGLLGTILTGVVTIYANTGDALAIRPDTPWWYAAKEAIIALLLAGAMLVGGGKEGSLLRTCVYSDAIFDIRRIESTVQEKGVQADYDKVLSHAALMTAGSLLFSAAMNFGLALYFLLPVPDMPVAEQAVQYNYAVSKMTWMGYLIIGVPLLATLFLVIRYLGKAIRQVTNLPEEQVYMR
ncbi:MAG: hypothetical protein IJN29_00755 [Akkermansia sp.]|nr:hypothetical protein [Akkermansia sp.]